MANWLPLVGVAVFVGVGFGWRSWNHHRRYGSSGIVLFRSGRRLQDLRELGMLLLGVVLAVQGTIAIVDPEVIASLSVLPVSEPRGWLGFAVMLGSTVLMVAAQLDMGASWRVGVDEGARPGLVAAGLYRVCRNPIYVALLGALIGYAAMLPTWISLALLGATLVTLRSQVKEEEAYLLRTYGNAYATYARDVGRFLPGLGRLRTSR